MDSQLTFKRYCGFDNHYDSKLIRKIRETIRTLGEEQSVWEATEKVHGSHFAVSVSRNESNDVFTLRGAKRSGFLLPDEKFFNYQSIIEIYRDQIEVALLLVQRKNLDVEQITIHGEIFGGLYPDKSSSGSAENGPTSTEDGPAPVKVQNGVFYSPDNDWYVFDIHDGKKYLDSDLTAKIFKKCRFFYSRPLYVGTFEEVLQCSNTFNSVIPEWLESPDWKEIGDNVAEGLVLKPRKTLYFSTGSRVMLKSKTEKFSEKLSKSRNSLGSPKEKEPEDPEVEAVWDALSLYITENRLNNVKSKDPNITGNKLIGPLANDVMDEFIRCHEDRELVKRFEDLTKTDKKKKGLVTRRLANACLTLVNGF